MAAHQDSTPVEYRDIVGIPGYRVGSDGSVWSCKTNSGRFLPGWHPIKVRNNAKGYAWVCLSAGKGIRARFPVARLVLTAFVGPRPDGMEACHLNDVRDDNRPENLVWGTHRENVAQRNARGRQAKGTANNSKLSERDVAEIRRLHGQGLSNPKIAARFGVSKQTVWTIVTGRKWQHLLV